MPLNCLLLCCLESATKTSVTQEGKTVDFPRRHKDDVVLVFKTDSEEYKARWVQTTVCDYLFYYTNTESRTRDVYLVFVELGGSKADHSVDQLRQTIKTVQQRLMAQNLAGKAKFRALLVYSSGSAPQDYARLQKEFSDKYQTTLKAKQGKRVDARAEFGI